MLTSSGFYCEACGVCADSLCIQTAELVLKCKDNFIQSSTTDSNKWIVQDQLHMWVKGNLTAQNNMCCICDRDIDYHGRPGLYGMYFVKINGNFTRKSLVVNELKIKVKLGMVANGHNLRLSQV